MLVNIVFHNCLLKFTNKKSHTIECSDFSSLVSALSRLFPELGSYINRIKNSTQSVENLCFLDCDKKTISQTTVNFNRLKDNHKTIYIVPVMAGAGGRNAAFIGLALGLALVALPLAFPATLGATAKGIGAALGKFMTNVGLNLILSGVVSLFNKPPKPPEAQIPDNQERIDNNLFSGLQNTTSSDSNIPINYGQVRVAGQLVSGYLLTKNHGKGDVIRVSESFN